MSVAESEPVPNAFEVMMQRPESSPSGEKKKCSRCYKMLSVDQFGLGSQGASKGKPLSKCMECMEKHNEQSRIAKAAKRAAAREAAADEGATDKMCNVCLKTLPIDSFAFSKSKGCENQRISQCAPCSKALLMCRAAYKKTEAGKASTKRHQNSEAGKARRERENAVKRRRRAEDPAFAKHHAIHRAANFLLSGAHKTSPTFEARTGWASDAFVAYIESRCRDSGFGFSERKSWQLDYILPQEAFDFSDPEDIKRCWDRRNLQVLTPTENSEKSWLILDKYRPLVPSNLWPASWGREWPSEEQKQALYQKFCKRSQPNLDEAGPSSAAEFESSGSESESESDE